MMTTTTTNLFLHPTAGMYGFTFAMVLNFACYHYSTLIVSKMAYHEPTCKVKVWFHNLPFLTEAETPIEFELGEIFLDRSKAEVIYLLEKLGGDMTDFRGHLPLVVQSDHFRSRFPLLVYCKDGYVVKDNNLFLDALLFDKMTEEEEEESEEWHRDDEMDDDSFPDKEDVATPSSTKGTGSSRDRSGKRQARKERKRKSRR